MCRQRHDFLRLAACVTGVISWVSVRRIHTCRPWYSGVIPREYSRSQVMGKTGRPGPTLDDYLYWQERLRVAVRAD